MTPNQKHDPFDSLVLPLIAISIIAKGLAKDAMAMCVEKEKSEKGEKKNEFKENHRSNSK